MGNQPVDEKVFVNFLEHINRNLTVIEIDAVMNVRIEFPEIPQVAVDAALFRLVNGEDTRSATRIQAVSQGSVTVIIAGTALAYWVLDKTIGETLKDAWKNSGLHRRLQRFLLLGQSEKFKRAIRDSTVASAKFYRHEDLHARFTSVRENFSDENNPFLDVDVEIIRSDDAPPTYAEVADDYNSRDDTTSDNQS